MKRRRLLRAGLGAAIVLLAAAGCIPLPGTQPVPAPPAPSGCITDVGPADQLVFSGCGNGITYNVSVPDICITKQCGLITDVHGWTMDANDQEANTGIAAIGRAENYIVIQPSSDDSSWGPLRSAAVADFMQLAISVWHVDARRVHLTGFSLGGVMAWWFRCNRADLVASVAPVSYSGAACTTNVRAVPTLYIQGHNDYYVPEADIQTTIDSVKTKHALDGGTVLAQDAGTWIHTRYQNGTTFVFETVLHNFTQSGNLGGHCIMGSKTPSSLYGCDQPSTLEHGRAIVDFFKANPKKPS